MRGLLVMGLIVLMAGSAGAQDRPVLPDGPPRGDFTGGERRGPLFISPMGEPFRGPEPQFIWFDQADADHDGGLTRDEFTADAMRFFAVLDRGHDGEIDPDDVTYYETVLAPQIRVGGRGAAIGGRVRPGGRFGGGGGRGRGGRRGGGDGGVGGGGGGGSGKTNQADVRQGAARFGYFDYPEPVTVADANLNRGVDPVEWRNTAADRFAALDKNHDGVIRRDELPKLPSPGRGGGRNRHGRGEGGFSGAPVGAPPGE